MKRSINKQVLFPVFLMALFTLAGIEYYSFVSNQQFIETSQDLSRIQKVFTGIECVLTDITDLETSSRAYVITADNDFTISCASDLKLVDAHLIELEQLILDPNQKKRIAELKKVIQKKINFSCNLIDVRRLQSFEAAKELVVNGEGKRLMKEVKAHIEEFKIAENQIFQNRIRRNETDAAKLKTIVASGSIVVFLFLLFSFFIIYRENNLLEKAEKELFEANSFQQAIISEQNNAAKALEESESKYRKLIEEAGDILYISNLKGNFTFISNRIEEIYGYKAEDLLGKHFTSIIHEEWVERVKTFYLKQFLEQTEETLFEFPIFNTEGQVRWVQQRVSLKKENGRPSAFNCIVRDITEKKETDEFLKKASKEIYDLYNNAPCGYHSIDESGTIVNMNSTELQWLGYTGEEVIGKMKMTDIIRPDSTADFATNFNRLLKEGWLNDVELNFRRKDGTSFPALINTRAIRDANGKFVQSRASIFDITRRKRAEKELQKSRGFLKTMIDNIPFAIFVKSGRKESFGKFILWNKTCEEMFGVKTEDAIGKTVYDFFPKEIADEMNRKDLENFKTGTIEDIVEEEIEHENHGRISLHTVKVPLFTENKKPEYLLCFSENITERKKAERELIQAKQLAEENKQKLQLILDNTNSVIFIKDTEGRYLLVNKQYEKVFHVTSNELLSKTDYDFSPKELADRYREKDLEVIRTGKLIQYEDEVMHDDGPHPNIIVKFPLYDNKGEMYGICGITTDISDRKKAEESLLHAKHLAEQARETQETFLANMSHEIRTPMNGVIGMTNLLLSTALIAEQLEYVNVIKESSGNLLVIINDILDISKIQSGKMTFEEVGFKPDEIVRSVVRSKKYEAITKNININKYIDPKVPPVLLGDPVRLSQILINLVGNAIKFTEKGEVKVSLERLPSEQDVLLRFSIEDTGIGIAEDKLNSIFESFTQANKSITRKFGGTGLGLAIARQLVELQGGTISVESVFGKGTTFIFTLTFKLGSENDLQANTGADGQTNYDLSDVKILLVEDNKVNQRVASLTLKKCGAEVDIASNGKLAIEKLENNHFDLILMDIQMPEMDGIATTQYIRTKMKKISKIPIIAMTAAALVGEKERCLAAGMNDYISKPFVPQVLYDKIAIQIKTLRKTSTPVMPPIKENDVHQSKDSVTDLSYLRELSAGNKGFEKEMMDLFIEQVPEELKELQESIRQKDFEAIKRIAHKMKSSVDIMGLKQMIEKLASIEQHAHAKQKLDEINSLYEEIRIIGAKAVNEITVEQKKHNINL